MPRHSAVNVLIDVIYKQKNLSISLEPYKNHEKKALISEFCYGVCRYYFTLKPVLGVLMEKSLKAKDKDIELTLILGLYQLKYMHLKPFAAVDETVKLAKILNKVWAKGLINAVLRRYIRDADTLEKKLSNNNEFNYAHPKWFIDLLTQYKLPVSDICIANNHKATIYLRVDNQKISTNDYLALLEEQGISASASMYLPSAIALESKVDITALPLFSKGAIFIQDLAAQFASTLLNLSDKQRVLDACSAPGGKLTAILQSPFSLKNVMALDSSAHRVKKINENLERLGQQAEVIVGDAIEPDQWWDGQLFDRILIDAPCSATGVIRRHPDIKILRTSNEVFDIAKCQKDILNALWPLLAPGGRLVYATCSVLPIENEFQIEKFIADRTDVLKVDFTLPLGKACTFGWQLLPGESDGFYYAVLEKIKN